MKIFNKEITFWHLITLVSILYILLTLIKVKENFVEMMSNVINDITKQNNTKPDKACSQKSVNYGYLSYIFNSPQSPQR